MIQRPAKTNSQAFTCEIIPFEPPLRGEPGGCVMPRLPGPQEGGSLGPLTIVGLTAAVFAALVTACLVWFSMVAVLAAAVVAFELGRRALRRLTGLPAGSFGRRPSYESH